MTPADAIARRRELVVGLLLPLSRGGPAKLGRPLGRGGAEALAVLDAKPVDLDEQRFFHDRDRRAAALLPVDAAPLPSPDEWRLAAILHDLLQASNPRLGWAFGDRTGELLQSVAARLAEIPPPATLGELVGRHVTFVGVPRLVRFDVDVRYWIGERSYRGEAPPARLLAWPKLRRVQQSKSRIGAEGLCDHAGQSAGIAFRAALAELARRVPTVAPALGVDVDVRALGARGRRVFARAQALADSALGLAAPDPLR